MSYVENNVHKLCCRWVFVVLKRPRALPCVQFWLTELHLWCRMFGVSEKIKMEHPSVGGNWGWVFLIWWNPQGLIVSNSGFWYVITGFMHRVGLFLVQVQVARSTVVNLPFFFFFFGENASQRPMLFCLAQNRQVCFGISWNASSTSFLRSTGENVLLITAVALI